MQVQSRATVPAQGRGEHRQTWGCLRREYSVVNHGGPGSVFTLATWQWLRTRSICVAAGGPSSVCPETDGWVPPQGPLVTRFPRPSEPVCSAAEGRFPSPNSGRVGAVDLGSPSLSWRCLSLQLGEGRIPEPPAGSCSRGLDALESQTPLWSGCQKNRACTEPHGFLGTPVLTARQDGLCFPEGQALQARRARSSPKPSQERASRGEWRRGHFPGEQGLPRALLNTRPLGGQSLRGTRTWLWLCRWRCTVGPFLMWFCCLLEALSRVGRQRAGVSPTPSSTRAPIRPRVCEPMLSCTLMPEAEAHSGLTPGWGLASAAPGPWPCCLTRRECFFSDAAPCGRPCASAPAHACSLVERADLCAPGGWLQAGGCGHSRAGAALVKVRPSGAAESGESSVPTSPVLSR